MFRWLIVPLIGAFIGWSTNVLAIRLLFRPRHPWKFLVWNLQGLIPKRREAIAASVAEVIDRDLLPWGELSSRLFTPEVEARLIDAVVEVASRRLIERLPSFIPLGLKETASRALEDTLRREMPSALEELKEILWRGGALDFTLGKVVAQKIQSLDLEQVEKTILQVAGHELRYIELLGGVLGFLIGLTQAALL